MATSMIAKSFQSRSISTPVFILLLVATATVLQLAIAIWTRMSTPEVSSNIPAVIVQAQQQQALSWGAYVEGVYRHDRSATSTQNPGLLQRIASNWGAHIVRQVEKQRTNQKHPAFGKSRAVGLTRAELNGNRLLKHANSGDLSHVKPGCENNCDLEAGALLTYVTPDGTPVRIILPNEAIQAIGIVYSQAAAMARTTGQSIDYDLEAEIAEYNRLQKQVQADFARAARQRGLSETGNEIQKLTSDLPVETPEKFSPADASAISVSVMGPGFSYVF